MSQHMAFWPLLHCGVTELVPSLLTFIKYGCRCRPLAPLDTSVRMPKGSFEHM